MVVPHLIFLFLFFFIFYFYLILTLIVLHLLQLNPNTFFLFQLWSLYFSSFRNFSFYVLV
ncbi:hypothetical protein Hanom_Chr03g00269421 [Helianthus anomalus]